MDFPPPTAKQAKMIWSAATLLAVSVVITLVVGFFWGIGFVLRVLSPVLWPLAIAGALAYLLDPVVDFLERRRVSRLRATILVFAFALAVLLAVIGWILPQALREARQFVRNVPTYKVQLEKKITDWMDSPPALLGKVLDLRRPEGEWLDRILPKSSDPTDTAEPTSESDRESDEASQDPNAADSSVESNGADRESVSTESAADVLANLILEDSFEEGEDTSRESVSRPDWSRALDSKAFRSMSDWLSRTLPVVGSWIFGQFGKFGVWFGFLAGIFLVPVYVFFFLVEKQGISKQWTDYLPVRNSIFKDELVFCLRAINDYLIAFFRSQVIVAICDGILYTIGFLIIGLPYAVLLGFVATFLTIIPFIGATLICGAALIIAFAATGGWQLPVLVLVVFAVIQTIEGLYLQPKIVGDRVGLHPLTVIVAVMVGTTFFGGLLGGILAIPLTAAMRVIMFRYVWVKRVDPKDPAQAEALPVSEGT